MHRCSSSPGGPLAVTSHTVTVWQCKLRQPLATSQQSAILISCICKDGSGTYSVCALAEFCCRFTLYFSNGEGFGNLGTPPAPAHHSRGVKPTLYQLLLFLRRTFEHINQLHAQAPCTEGAQDHVGVASHSTFLTASCVKHCDKHRSARHACCPVQLPFRAGWHHFKQQRAVHLTTTQSRHQLQCGSVVSSPQSNC
jgi:hypothetical protein